MNIEEGKQEPDKGPDYWKDKYRRLKERMQELINDKED